MLVASREKKFQKKKETSGLRLLLPCGLLFTKQQTGHRRIETTLVYTQLVQFDKDDNYTCKVAQNIQQATELVENGFEYVTEMGGLKLFRKRK